jgi:cell division protease FtsH
MQTPTEERFLMSKTELQNRIATLLGGRAAEEIVFEDISTGAHNDLARATDIACSMVKEYGMSSKVGQVYFSREKNNQFLNIPQQGAAEYSQATAKLIDEEVKAIIHEQYENAKEILIQTQHILHKGAKMLLENEKIEGKALQDLMRETQDESSENLES